MIRQAKMDLWTFLKHAPVLSDSDCFDAFLSSWRRKQVSKEAHLARQGHPEKSEFILLDGCLASSICDQDGKEVCVGLYVGPCVVTPNIARARDGVSLVSMVATTDASIARMDTDLLLSKMISSVPVRDWANNVLRDALSQKVDREWCLAALSGAERLSWFRRKFPDHEDIFTHALIASYLGITPVTMSRLRTSARQI